MDAICCAHCNKLFTPTNKKDRLCSNLCNVRVYQSRQKIRKLLYKIYSPEALQDLQTEIEALINAPT